MLAGKKILIVGAKLLKSWELYEVVNKILAIIFRILAIIFKILAIIRFI